MVSVSLLKLVCIDGTRHIWPEEFAALVAKIEENPGERSNYGVIADWLDSEPDRHEPELAEGFRWLMKRPEIRIEKSTSNWSAGLWIAHNLPKQIDDVISQLPNDDPPCAKSIAVVAALVYFKIDALRKLLD